MTVFQKNSIFAFIFFIHFICLPLQSKDNLEEVFAKIYTDKVWGQDEDGNGTSGSGSSMENTIVYRAFLENFLEKYNIKSVVDVGCGDWQFSKSIDWTGIDYLGYDVVQSVIENNEKQYSNSNIHFIFENAITANLPSADLLICKDVLQHLSFEDVYRMILQFKKFKYCLITNDVNSNSLTTYNTQIASGGYRELDLTQPPFSISGQKVLAYQSYSSGYTHTKLVLLIIR